MGAAVRLLGAQQVAWAEAMQAEVAAVDNEREALSFAWGCFLTALGHSLSAARGGLAAAQNAGVLACSATVLLGCAFMHSAGAPGHYVWMNLASLAFAVATFRLLPRRRLQADDVLRVQLALAMGAMLLITSLGPSAMAASAWHRVWTVPVNLTWLLVPALLVAADVRARSTARPWAVGGLLMASGSLALQADATMAALVAVVLVIRAWRHRSGALMLLGLANAATALRCSEGWPVTETLPFVDLVVQRGFEHSLSTGLALAMLQLLPLWPALRHRQARSLGLVWGLLVALSWPGWLPSPLVGFGGSFIVAYLLSLALLGDATDERPAGAPWQATARRRWYLPPLPPLKPELYTRHAFRPPAACGGSRCMPKR